MDYDVVPGLSRIWKQVHAMLSSSSNSVDKFMIYEAYVALIKQIQVYGNLPILTLTGVAARWLADGFCSENVVDEQVRVARGRHHDSNQRGLSIARYAAYSQMGYSDSNDIAHSLYYGYADGVFQEYVAIARANSNHPTLIDGLVSSMKRPIREVAEGISKYGDVAKLSLPQQPKGFDYNGNLHQSLNG